MSKVELLAPAGNMEAFKAAINNGADAVYLGLNNFNARMKADNFTIENIRNIVEYAHLFSVKVYLTINIILKDEEIDEFLYMIDKCVEAKVDAYIVQDFGVAYLLKNRYKNICLHASTQMGIHNLLGAKVAEKFGFKRIILSRETTLKDIKNIKDNTNLEIEFFVQGALCVGFSGNCYISSFLSNESGNRGRCKQYCRQKYSVYDNKERIANGYYLSAKDLCLANELRALVNAGVISFKIEGRMRREGYVALAVKTYRKIIDDEFRKINEEELNELRVAFSRGDFNNYAYLNANNKGIINEKNQNHLGLKIGKVLSIRPFKNNLYELDIFSTHELSEGDGLKFMNGNHEVASLGVGNVIKKRINVYKIFTKQKITKANLDVYLTLDNKKEDELINITKKILVNARVSALEDNNLEIILKCGNVNVRYISNFICEKAINQITGKEDIIKQISKLNDTYFVLNSIDFDLDNVFIPKSILNDLRRESIALLKDKLIQNYEKEYNVEILSFNEQNTYEFTNYGDAIIINEDIDLDLLDKDYQGLIIYAPKIYYLEINNKLDYLRESFKNARVALNLPIIAFYSDLELLESIVKKIKNTILVANNIYALYFADKFEVIASNNLNINNNFALKFMKEIGVKSIIASVESNKEFMSKHSNLYYYSFGYNTLMNYVHCPFKSVYKCDCNDCKYHEKLLYKDDFTSNSYQIRRIKLNRCYFELLNSNAINVYKKVNNPAIVDLRNVINVDKVVEMIATKNPSKIESKETTGLFFKIIN
ncbi:MAG: U32 family peptidase [Erysipelotrichales bacterium]|nr:U32 family peptidase [Erysipelotrichales bacterium]